MQISKRLSVEGPDNDGEYEVTLQDNGRDSAYYTFITRAEADALIAALQPLAPVAPTNHARDK